MVELCSDFHFCPVSAGEIKCAKQCSGTVGGKCPVISPRNSHLFDDEALVIFMPLLLSGMQILGEASGRRSLLQLPREP